MKKIVLLILFSPLYIIGYGQIHKPKIKNIDVILKSDVELRELAKWDSEILTVVPKGSRVSVVMKIAKEGFYEVYYDPSNGNIPYVGYMNQSNFSGNIISAKEEVKVIIPIPVSPAKLIVSSLLFNENSDIANNVLDGGEEIELSFSLSNNGKGKAYDIRVEINVLHSVKGLKFTKNMAIGNIASGEGMIINIPIFGSMQLESDRAEFEIIVTEGNGFDADPFKFSFETQAFKNPILAIADHKFTTENGGKVRLGQVVSLGFVVQNKGQGVASNVKIRFIIPKNVYPASDSEFEINELKANESKYLDFEFFTNKKYNGLQIPIEVVITESYKKHGERKTLIVKLEESLSQTKQINITAQYKKQVTIESVSLTSDVDKNIPVNDFVNHNAFALIIGNEDYSSYQRNISSEADVAFANNDAIIFKKYCIKTLGVPEQNITLLLNATAGKMSQSIDRLNKIVKATNGKAQVYVYYAGHGLPDEITKEPYLIPVDVSGSNITSAIKLSSMYKKLTEHSSQQVTVFLDACFSGGARDQGLLATRGVRIKPKEGNLIGNIVVFAASSGDESSLALKQKQHGMFTYFLLKKIQETKGSFTYSELDEYLKEKVGLESVRTNGKSQNPQVLVSPDQIDEWEELKIIE